MIAKGTSIIVLLLLLSVAAASLVTVGLKVIDKDVTPLLTDKGGYSLFSIGDFDRDGDGDIALGIPDDSTKFQHGGSLHIFWGEPAGFPPFYPYNADLSFYGPMDFGLGSSVVAWDLYGTGWKYLVIGCFGAYEGAGTALIFEPVIVNDAPKGKELFRSDSVLELNGTQTVGMGALMVVGELSDDRFEDLALLSTGNDTIPSKATAYLGGTEVSKEVTMDIGAAVIMNDTRAAHMDLYGRGREALIVSTPERGEVRVIHLNISERRAAIPGANTEGIVDFPGTITSTGNTFGWGAGDDGWDTSPTHIYDASTGFESVRYNQATGNAITYDRSISRVREQQIEVGGVLTTSSDRSQSGAYGVSFQITPSEMENINSAILYYDFKYEDFGFENNERMWIKTRFTSPPGTVRYLGYNLDSNADATSEVWTMVGVNSGSTGTFQSGKGSLSMDLYDILNGPGEYYLDLGGKVSRWTQPNEFGLFQFDNISLTFRSLALEIDVMTGSGLLGSSILTTDVDGDGTDDLLLSSPQEGKVRIFKGGLRYWDDVPSLTQWLSNMTISGTPGGSLGSALALIGSSTFTPDIGLLVSDPEAPGDQRSGAVHLFHLPLTGGDIPVGNAFFVDKPAAGEYDYGKEIFPVMDPDGDGFDAVMYTAFDANGKLMTMVMERSPTAPAIRFLNPRWHQTVAGKIEIRIELVDPDGDADPMDIRLFKAADNNTWFYFGNGFPDRVEGNVAIKDWDTNAANNGKYFLKATIQDDYGLQRTIYTDYVEVFNHAPPVVTLVYPGDGIVLKGKETVSARVSVLSGEVLDHPVTFHLSRDNMTFQQFAEFYGPSGGVGNDYIIELDTGELEDGPIWFRANASTEYGLGTNVTNNVPCIINNTYGPVIEMLYVPSVPVTGVQNITVRALDQDGDLVPPVQLFYREPGYPGWDLLANMTGPIGTGNYHHLWDTTEVDNGEYELKTSVSDSTFLYSESVLNTTLVVHNLYPPSVRFFGISTGDTVKGIVRVKAEITDRDMNIVDSNVSFYYRKDGLDTWSSMGQVVLSLGTAYADWETTNMEKVPNGQYDLRVDVTDMDNQTANVVLPNVRVLNPYLPRITLRLPSNQVPLSGTVRLMFNLSDDAPLRDDNITVDVFVFDHWEVLDGTRKEGAGGAFVPWKDEAYYVDWDTTEKKDNGDPRFPDGPGYDVRVTVRDQDGLVETVKTPVSFDVKNKGGVVDDDDDDPSLSLPSWLLAVLGLLVFVLIIVLLLGMVLFKKEKREEGPPLPPMMPPPPVERHAPAVHAQKDRSDSIYTPPGWETAAETPPPVQEDIPMFTTDQGTPDLGMFSTEPEPTGTVSAPVPPPRRETKRPKHVRDEPVPDVVLPEGVVPTAPDRKKAPKRPKKSKKEAEPDVEDWDIAEEVEEFEEMDEEPPEVLIVECRCGNEIEVEEGTTKFTCPECGRTGKLKK
jgi:hypothetical protein